MDFGTAVKTCFSKYATFSGRAQRSEYWWFYLFTVLGSLVLSVVDLATNPNTEIFSSIFSLAVLIPTLSAASRRLHDTNRSGWWQLLPLIGILIMVPGFFSMFASGGFENGLMMGSLIVGGLVLLVLGILLIVWLATDSHAGENRFGPNPKDGVQVDDVFS